MLKLKKIDLYLGKFKLRGKFNNSFPGKSI